MDAFGLDNCVPLKLPSVSDARGQLCFAEAGIHVPFEIKRVFWVFGTPQGAVRGHHAHKASWQAHVCINGSVKISLDDGCRKQDVCLDSPESSFVIGPLVWHSFELSPGAALFVMTSNRYDEGDYLRDYNEFLKAVS